MPPFKLATVDRQHVIHCLFSFYRNGQKHINCAQKPDNKRNSLIKIENFAQHLSHIICLGPCYMALANASY